MYPPMGTGAISDGVWYRTGAAAVAVRPGIAFHRNGLRRGSMVRAARAVIPSGDPDGRYTAGDFLDHSRYHLQW